MAGATKNPKKRELKVTYSHWFMQILIMVRCNGKSQETGIESSNTASNAVRDIEGATENPKKRELKDIDTRRLYRKCTLCGCNEKSQETGIESCNQRIRYQLIAVAGCNEKSQETGIESR